MMRIQTKQIDWVKWGSLFLMVLFAVLWLRGCSSGSQPELAEVVVPETKSVFPVKKPINTPLIKANSPQLKSIEVENPINQKLIAENERLKSYIDDVEKLKSDFAKEKDSLKKQLAYAKAVQLNKFSKRYDDDNLTLNIDGIAQGEVKEITPSYVIKEKKVAIKEKQMILRVLGGVEVGNTPVLDNFQAKANLMFQNRKGNVFSASMDTHRMIWVGYSASIFSFNK